MSEDGKQSPPATLDEDLLEILVCPETKAELVLDGERLVSTDAATRRAYRIEDGIPRMLVEESEQLAQADWDKVMQAHGKA